MGSSVLGKYWGRFTDSLFLNKTSRSTDLDVILHIGAPKTGSSAIQRFCLNNRDQLLRAGYYYPRHSLDKNGVSGGHSLVGNLLREGRVRKANLYFRLMLLGARLQGKTLLLSSESFHRNARSFGPLLQGLNVRVVGWFRHPVEAFVSNYNQSVKRHFRTADISEMLDERFMKTGAANLNGRRLRQWADVVGDRCCTFLPYVKESKSGGSLQDEAIERVWLRVLGVDAGKAEGFVFDDKRVNRSYVEEALELKRLLNLVLSSEEGGLASRVDWALQDYSDSANDTGSSLGVYLKPDQVQRLNERFSRSNSILVRRFPSLKPILKQGDAYVLQAEVSKERALDLSLPLAHLQYLYPDDFRSLQSRVSDQVGHGSSPSGELLYLAGLLGVYSKG
ncbi:hypothetical protein [Marinimicrobium sp. LS-A18]|uniref:hypothetical protein n=1 Tax=Marinimicrobium sp. LS-A18 TaxID=1381596 RepID=UPI0004ACBED9|nr:hypothetical protein [Marinimicrobium sp. LS-A18]